MKDAEHKLRESTQGLEQQEDEKQATDGDSRYHVVIFLKGVNADCFKTTASYMKEKGVVLENVSVSSDISVEIWGCIASDLGILDRYNLAVTCNAMWGIVKAIPYPEFFAIDPSIDQFGSFHFATLTSIRISGTVTDYNKLKALFAAVTHLARIDLTSVPIVEKSADRIIYCIPRVSRFYKITVFVKGADAHCFKAAVKALAP
ncbi:hypothetical protein MBANPS3_012285 [Mucor bainieri]